MGRLLGGGADIPDMPTTQAEQPKRTAEPVKQLSAQAKKNKQIMASLLTKDWNKDSPTLSQKGLLGM